MTEPLINHLISQWGYLAVAAGALAEGETFVLAGGYAAHRGLLDWPGVLIAAALAGFCGDQLFYWIGRIWGVRLIARWPWLARRQGPVRDQLQRHATKAIVAVRFLYGLRIAGPILIGAAHVPPWRYLAWNAVGAVLWAGLVVGAGWLFGQVLDRVAGRLHAVEVGLLILVAATVGGALLQRWIRARRAGRPR